ncbi:DUF7146 domain-containing protein [Bartonella machadoae]|uniref:DUF7146 domain-containing protein n=1 Tax=Bartonella machadoae TaxID=2893471 RepID=UPI001F4CC0E8|nr:toprim domain-containing protein [Bartonella machadoae]UNE55571.1 toprim domain-containing protein [Bartonella machadoae]UNE55605.1 toprim domain-containing protein [Bartonella machadoae]
MHCTNAQSMVCALHGVWHGHYGLARCPAHDDRSPSLALANGNDGRLLLYCYAGCSFREILQALKNIGLIDKNAYCQKEKQAYFVHKTSCYNRSLLEQKTAIQKVAKAQEIWKQSQPIKGTIAELYLRKRGITCELPSNLRFHSKCPHPSGKTIPALVALVEGGGSFAIHRTFLQDNGCKTEQLPTKAMLGSVKGGAVHLSQANHQHLVICEGIETGLSLLSGLLSEPVTLWASLSTSGMTHVNLPHIKSKAHLTIAMDGDEAGRKAGFALATRAQCQGFEVLMMQAPEGADFNVLLLNYEREK